MRMITCVAWKANRVLDGSRLLVLIKNHRQLNCGAVVLYWPVIASETRRGDCERDRCGKALRTSCPPPCAPAPPVGKKKSGLCKLSSTRLLSQCGDVSSVEDSFSCLRSGTSWDKNVTWTHSACGWKSSGPFKVLLPFETIFLLSSSAL